MKQWINHFAGQLRCFQRGCGRIFPAPWPLGVALTLGTLLGWFGSMGCATSRQKSLDYTLMNQAWNIIENNYVDTNAVKPTALTYGAISGMIDALGDTDHSTFLTPEMVKKMKAAQSGRLIGIGIEIQNKAGHVVVVTPLDNSPAQRAGLRPGDIILKIDGQSVAGWSLGQVVERIYGKPGTLVSLSLLDPHTSRTRDVNLKRAIIQLQNVTWHQLPGTRIAHLRLASFDLGLTKNLRQALAGIEKAGLEGIILDLRDNPGGILGEAIATASQFVSNGNVVLIKDAKGRITPVPAESGGLALRIPLVVLINDGSASAAEIVAGAIKDAGRGTLVGDTTFGTGTVLQEFRLADGSELLLAIEEWLTPNGHSFWHKGITPEVSVSLPTDVLPLSPEREGELTAAQLQAGDDRQLLRALEILTEQTRKEMTTKAP